MTVPMGAITLRFGHSTAATDKSQNHIFAVKFAELAEEYSNGEIEIKIFPSNQLGSEQDRVQKIRLQSKVMTSVAISNLAPFAESAGVYSLPYLFSSTEDVFKLLNGPFAETIQERVSKEAGLRILGYLVTDFRVLTNSKKPICKISDLQGLKIRVTKNPLRLGTFKAWGATPIPMAWSEVFTALQQGVIDGQENPIITNYANNFQEVQKYITLIHYNHWIAPVLIGEQAYGKLSPTVQLALNRAVEDAALHERAWAREYTAKALQALKDAGMEVCVPEDEEVWRDSARSVWPQFYDLVGGKDLVDEALASLAE
tara:strand:+ start:929 stop:1870 length:942 start_codon:yes stop_codon:yes gene_type:complete